MLIKNVKSIFRGLSRICELKADHRRLDGVLECLEHGEIVKKTKSYQGNKVAILLHDLWSILLHPASYNPKSIKNFSFSKLWSCILFMPRLVMSLLKMLVAKN